MAKRLGTLDTHASVVETARPFLRVIAGEFGGRRLEAPKGDATRPTSDRVREAMFMALEPLAGMRVIDLFAGSGALGIEALSRGASWVDFVEASFQARRALASNVATLELGPRCKIWSLRLPGGVRRLASALRQADLVLADPPYGGSRVRQILDLLGEPATLRPGSRVVVEHHSKDEVPERAGALACERRRRYGETTISIYRPAAGTESGAEEGP